MLNRVETMAAEDKILKSLESAMTYLENSKLALNEKDESALADDVWHVAAELEYTLFLFSITVQDENDKSKWKVNPKSKKLEVSPTLIAVRDLLGKAEKSMKNKNLLEAYKSAYNARHHILRLQKDFSKKKREALKKE